MAATKTKRGQATTDRFLDYARDAKNWSGSPLVGGNVGGDRADRGYIVNMKKRGWVTTHKDDKRDVRITFTPAGIKYANSAGITCSHWATVIQPDRVIEYDAGNGPEVFHLFQIDKLLYGSDPDGNNTSTDTIVQVDPDTGLISVVHPTASDPVIDEAEQAATNAEALAAEAAEAGAEAVNDLDDDAAVRATVEPAIHAFEELQVKHQDLGAGDTEPDGIFQQIVAMSAAGYADFVFPYTGKTWQLFTGKKGVAAAGLDLERGARHAAKVIRKEIAAGRIKAVRRFATDYCWRVDVDRCITEADSGRVRLHFSMRRYNTD